MPGARCFHVGLPGRHQSLNRIPQKPIHSVGQAPRSGWRIAPPKRQFTSREKQPSRTDEVRTRLEVQLCWDAWNLKRLPIDQKVSPGYTQLLSLSVPSSAASAIHDYRRVSEYAQQDGALLYLKSRSEVSILPSAHASWSSLSTWGDSELLFEYLLAENA